MMIDRTQEDINQDSRIAGLQRQISAMQEKLEAVCKQQNVLTNRTVDHEERLGMLEPLAALVEFVEHIKGFFESTRGRK